MFLRGCLSTNVLVRAALAGVNARVKSALTPSYTLPRLFSAPQVAKSITLQKRNSSSTIGKISKPEYKTNEVSLFQAIEQRNLKGVVHWFHHSGLTHRGGVIQAALDLARRLDYTEIADYISERRIRAKEERRKNRVIPYPPQSPVHDKVTLEFDHNYYYKSIIFVRRNDQSAKLYICCSAKFKWPILTKGLKNLGGVESRPYHICFEYNFRRQEFQEICEHIALVLSALIDLKNSNPNQANHDVFSFCNVGENQHSSIKIDLTLLNLKERTERIVSTLFSFLYRAMYFNGDKIFANVNTDAIQREYMKSDEEIYRSYAYESYLTLRAGDESYGSSTYEGYLLYRAAVFSDDKNLVQLLLHSGLSSNYRFESDSLLYLAIDRAMSYACEDQDNLSLFELRRKMGNMLLTAKILLCFGADPATKIVAHVSSGTFLEFITDEILALREAEVNNLTALKLEFYQEILSLMTAARTFNYYIEFHKGIVGLLAGQSPERINNHLQANTTTQPCIRSISPLPIDQHKMTLYMIDNTMMTVESFDASSLAINSKEFKMACQFFVSRNTLFSPTTSALEKEEYFALQLKPWSTRGTVFIDIIKSGNEIRGMIINEVLFFDNANPFKTICHVKWSLASRLSRYKGLMKALTWGRNFALSQQYPGGMNSNIVYLETASGDGFALSNDFRVHNPDSSSKPFPAQLMDLLLAELYVLFPIKTILDPETGLTYIEFSKIGNKQGERENVRSKNSKELALEIFNLYFLKEGHILCHAFESNADTLKIYNDRLVSVVGAENLDAIQTFYSKQIHLNQEKSLSTISLPAPNALRI